jgi:hypothetical protein
MHPRVRNVLESSVLVWFINFIPSSGEFGGFTIDPTSRNLEDYVVFRE